MKRSRDLPEHPADWRQQDPLEFLYDELGWTVNDIVDHFEEIGSDEVTEGRVRRKLDTYEIRCGRNDRPPVSGGGAALWEADKDAAFGGDA